MADVDLSVAVTRAGVREAISDVNALKAAATATDAELVKLGRTSKAVFAAMGQEGTRSAGQARTAVDQLSASIRNNTLDAARAEATLTGLNAKYAALASTGGTVTLGAANRIAALGNGNLASGIAQAQYAQQLRDAMNPNMARDLNVVLAEQNALLSARERLLASQKGVSQANWQASLAGMTPVQRATEQLTRAEKELATAQNRVAEARRGQFRGAGNNFITLDTETQKIQAQAAANDRLARAILDRSRAQQEMNRVAASAQNEDSVIGAYQGLIAYSVIASGANRIRDSILEVGGASITASRELERSFADVDRTFDGTDSQLASLQNRLYELSTSTPISFGDLSEIAALGNQLNVQAEDIEAFTQTIAQYTAISGESAETASTAFGRIANLTGLSASQFNNLGSAITYVARTSVATESTIQNTAKEISALSAGAGFSAQSIVGLAGALSSLAIPPERARGALSLYFGALNSAVAEGGPKLAAFAQLTNMSATELERLVRNNQGQEVFTAFISGLSQLDTVAKTTALDTLGLSTIRVDQTMRALAQNVPLVTSAFAGANRAFEENTELARQYAIIQDTLDSKIIEFQNAMQNAASAVGDQVAPALGSLLVIITDILVGFREFANTPLGAGLIGLAAIVTTIILVISTLIGVLALAKVAMTVIPWALTGLQVNGATAAVIKFIGGLLGMNIVAADATRGQVALSVATRGTAVATAATTAGLRAMKIALASTGIGLAIVLLGSLYEAFNNTSDSIKITSDQISGLDEAIKKDTEIWKETGYRIGTFRAATSESVEDQDAAARASANWANVLGTDLVEGANAASQAISEIAAGDNVVEAFREALGANADISSIISDSEFSRKWSSIGLNMTDLIRGSIRGDDIRASVYDALREAGYQQFSERTDAGPTLRWWEDPEGNNVNGFIDQIDKVIGAVDSEGEIMQETANKADVLGTSTSAAGSDAESAASGFRGATESLTAYQDAIQSAISQYVGFDTVLQNVQDKLDQDNPLKINASQFGTGLAEANKDATDFYTDIQQLAANGNTTFATELAKLGPDAQNILATALDLSPEAQQQIEVNARLAAFLASDQFKATFQENMENANNAYAQILNAGGSLADVQSFIEAQVSGAGEAAERQWAIDHPEFPLNLTPNLMNPSEEQIQFFEDQLSGRITITPGIVAYGASTPLNNTYTDTVSGASITLPADLDEKTLSASLSIWKENQNATPAEIEALLNTTGFNEDIDNWQASHPGGIRVYATLVPTNTGSVVGAFSGKINQLKAQGGMIPMPVASDYRVPKFASGGGFRVTGGGSGTDDRYLAAVSAGEFWNTKDSVNFWGEDVFQSLNRKMFPSSFLGLLGRAMVSGNSGPSHVAYVTTTQVNPLTRDPLKQLREESDNVAAGVWGGS